MPTWLPCYLRSAAGKSTIPHMPFCYLSPSLLESCLKRLLSSSFLSRLLQVCSVARPNFSRNSKFSSRSRRSQILGPPQPRYPTSDNLDTFDASNRLWPGFSPQFSSPFRQSVSSSTTARVPLQTACAVAFSSLCSLHSTTCVFPFVYHIVSVALPLSLALFCHDSFRHHLFSRQPRLLPPDWNVSC